MWNNESLPFKALVVVFDKAVFVCKAVEENREWKTELDFSIKPGVDWSWCIVVVGTVVSLIVDSLMVVSSSVMAWKVLLLLQMVSSWSKQTLQMSFWHVLAS